MSSVRSYVSEVKRDELYTNVENGNTLNIYSLDDGVLTTHNANNTNYSFGDIGFINADSTTTGVSITVGGISSGNFGTGVGKTPLTAFKVGMPLTVTWDNTTLANTGTTGIQLAYVLTNNGSAITLSKTRGGAVWNSTGAGEPNLSSGAATLTVVASPIVGEIQLRSLGKTIRTPAQNYLITSGGLTNQAIFKKMVVVKPATNSSASGTSSNPGEGDGTNSAPIYINLLESSFVVV
jgi:hypothetical protein